LFPKSEDEQSSKATIFFEAPGSPAFRPELIVNYIIPRFDSFFHLADVGGCTIGQSGKRAWNHSLLYNRSEGKTDRLTV